MPKKKTTKIKMNPPTLRVWKECVKKAKAKRKVTKPFGFISGPTLMEARKFYCVRGYG
jgi:hypothetical protein